MIRIDSPFEQFELVRVGWLLNSGVLLFVGMIWFSLLLSMSLSRRKVIGSR